MLRIDRKINLSILCLMSCLLIAGCDQLASILSSPDKTPPNDYHVYYHFDADDESVPTDSFRIFTPIYSTASLKIIDTVIDDLNTFTNDLRFTSDGKFKILNQNYLTYGPFNDQPLISVVDVLSNDTLSKVERSMGRKLRISNDNNFVIISDRDKPVNVYSIPSLEFLWRNDYPFFNDVEFLPEHGLFIAYTATGIIHVIDFINDSILIQEVPLDTTYRLENMGIDYSSGLIYFLGSSKSSTNGIMQIRKTSDFSIVKELVIPNDYTTRKPVISNSGDLIFLSNSCADGNEAGIKKFNTNSGILSQYLSASEFNDIEFQPFEVLITPDEKTLIVHSSSQECEVIYSTDLDGDLLFFDIRTRVLKSNISHDKGVGVFARIYPKEQ